MKAGLACAALLLLALQYQISNAEDLYWEGEEDSSNEFLEVKEEPAMLGHLKRLKRQFNLFNPFSLLSSPTTTTSRPENYEAITEDQDDTLFDNKDDDDRIEGSGTLDRVDPDIGEKTLRVTFVVMEPYRYEYSNRDSVLFQNFSKTLADAVNQLFEKLPGTQKASLVRIQSRLADEFSCKVTLDIVTIGFDDTTRITEVLREHIRKYGKLGHVSVKDADFNANVVKPGSAFDVICQIDEIQCGDGKCIPSSGRCNKYRDCDDGVDEMGCSFEDDTNQENEQENELDNELDNERPLEARCENPLPCASSVVTYCPDQRCDDHTDCPLGDDEKNCEDLGIGRNEEEYATETITESEPEAKACLPGEFTCDETRCIPNSARCDSIADCTDKTDELGCNTESCGVDDFRCNNGKCIERSARCNHVADCPDMEDELDCTCLENEFRCVSDGLCIEGRKRCDNIRNCRDGSDELDCECPPERFTCSAYSNVRCATQCDGIQECDDGEDEEDCKECPHECDDKCLNEDQICNGIPDCSNASDELNCPNCDGPDDFRCDNGECLRVQERCNNVQECADGSDERYCNTTVWPTREGCLDGQFQCSDDTCINIDFVCDNRTDCNDGSDEENCSCKYYEFKCASGQCVHSSSRCDRSVDCDDASDELNCPYEYPYQNVPTPSPAQTTTPAVDDKDVYVPGRDPINPRPRYPNNPKTGRPGSAPDDADYEDNEFTTEPTDDRYDPYGRTTSRYDPYQTAEPNAGNGYPNSGNPYGNNNYPSTSRPGYPGPGEDPYGNNNYPSTSRPGYPRPGEDPYGNNNYPSTSRPGYPRPGEDPYGNNNYPSTSRPGYPRPGEDPYGNNNYPSTSRPGYPESAGDPYGNNYPSTSRPSYPGSEDQYGGVNYPSGGAPGQPGYPSSGPAIGGSAGGASEPCGLNEWRCENGPCIDARRRCDGHIDCPYDYSDEFDCPAGSPVSLKLVVYPEGQSVRYGGDVVMQCRDEGPSRAPVRWVREEGKPMKPGFVERKGRLELNAVTLADGGVYYCQAPAHLGRPDSQVRVVLKVEPPRQETKIPLPHVYCKPHEATCGNGQCIPKSAVCDGKIDCNDRSDEDTCYSNGKCEPNQIICANNKCVSKNWICDGEDDCGDNTDEQNCAPPEPGSECSSYQFACKNDSAPRCIPKSFQCDGHSDCSDKSDEVGCIGVYITKTPTPANLKLNPGDTLILSCEAVGVPTPVISWRLNWGHIPKKCITSSKDGVGALSCPNMQPEDSGAYSCEGLNIKGTAFASPDSIVLVNRLPTQENPCPSAYFNSEARDRSECIRCFCFGESTQCRSADLFTFNMPTPLGEGGTKLLGVALTPDGEMRTDSSITNHYYYQSLRNGAAVTKLVSYEQNRLGNFHPYLTLPESYNGNQLTSYGGYIKFDLSPHSHVPLRDDSAPTVIVKGRYRTLFHNTRIDPSRESHVEIRLTPEYWQMNSSRGFIPASREDIMMALDQVDSILLRADLNNAGVNITEFTMESAQHINVGLGAANLVEECTCPPGYEGLSCQKCAAGYVREMSGPWLGNCVRKPCPPGTYGDPASGLACKPCPCPGTNRNNQFAQTCSIDYDGTVTCDCFPGYQGKNCEYCAPGYTGNPLIAGDTCKIAPTDKCNPTGTRRVRPVDECICKENVQGRFCDQCTNSSFYLSTDFSHGCASCFCTGVSKQCMSSNFRRQTTYTQFNTPYMVDRVKLYSSEPVGAESDRYQTPKQTNLRPVLTRSGLGLQGTDNSKPVVYYWAMPVSFSGDKVTTYGGYLRYTLENVPSYYGSPKNSAADVQLISDNHLIFQYHGDFEASREGVLNVSVQFLEKGWQRSDGNGIIREHFLLALADVQAILIKATYSPGSHAILKSASIDTAEPGGDGPPALHVEQCVCPPGYSGTSCEDCAPGYTRSGTGIYLELCGPCECNGHSRECHRETGECKNCLDNTDGPRCENCKYGYELDSYGNCVEMDTDSTCLCDPRGELTPCTEKMEGYCACKRNVQGAICDMCRPGTFGLDIDNPDGCLTCFCSGVTTDCQEADDFARISVPVPILGENFGGYTIMDLNAERVYKESIVPVPDKSELIYTFNFAPDRDLFWSLPVFPGRYRTGIINGVLAYNGLLSFRQEFRSNSEVTSGEGMDVVLVGDGISVHWMNNQIINSNQSHNYEVRLTEKDWFILNTATPASRSDFMRVLKSLKRVLVRATVADNLISTSIADVILETATETVIPDAPSARGIEVCTCPPGHQGTSCENCVAGYYKDRQDYCTPCPCNGHDCQLDAYDKVICNCKPPFTGSDCSARGDSQVTTSRPSIPQSTVTVKIDNPTIRIQEIGSSVNFTCQATSAYSERLPVTWIKVDGELPQGRTYIDNGLLKITNLQISDSGQYICQTVDGISSGQAKVTLKVPTNDMTLPAVEIRPAVNEYYEGDSITLDCVTSGNPTPTITWQRASRQPLPMLSEITDHSLIISNVREEDSGEYRCIASNTYGSVDRTALITVRPRPSRPSTHELKVSPTSPTINEGQNQTLVCTGSTNVPAGTIDWIRKDGDRFRPNVRSNNGVLYIESAIPENGGIYICQTHAADVNPVQVILTVVPLGTPSPEEQPQIAVNGNNIVIPTGESNTIDCIPKGYPLPTIRWSRSQGEFGPGTSQQGNTLIINNAQDSDRGYYVCEGIVDNKVMQIIYVAVEIEKREPPRVQIYPQNGKPVDLGTPYEFHCQVIAGIPRPDITWSRRGGRTLSKETDLLPDNILRFKSVDVNDEGEYICTASNLAGMDIASALLQVRSLPEITITPSNDVGAKYGEPVNIECRANGYPEPKVSITGPNNREIASPTSGIAYLRIVAASESDEGEYECIANSTAGSTKEAFVIKVDRGDGGDNDFDTGNDVDDDGYNQNPYPARNDEVAVVGQREAIIYCQVPRGFRPVWTRANRQPLQDNARQNRDQLIIYNVSENDAGVYDCNIYDDATNDARQATQTVLRVVEPPRIMIRPRTVVVRPGDSPAVECFGQGDNLEYIWKPYRKNLSNRVQIRGSVLMFDRIEPEDAGKYECTVRNQYANASDLVDVIVSGNDNNPDNFDNYPDQYPEQPSNLIATEGQRETPIYCDVPEGFTPVWSRADGRPLQNNARQEGARLVIYGVTSADSGEYVCNVHNQINYEIQKAVHTRLLVVRAPKITLNPPSQTVLPGQSPSVECIVEGDNVIEVTWKPYNRDLPRRVRVRNSTLEFHQIEVEDAGKYECVARTQYANASAIAEVAVASPPEESAPYVRIENPQRRFRVGENVKILCKTDGRRTTSATWEKWDEQGTRQYVDSQPYGDGAMLTITGVTEADAGTYRCTGVNPRGRSSYEDFDLEVEPGEPSYPSYNEDVEVANYIVRLSQDIDMPCNHNLEGPVNIQWRREYIPLPSDIRTDQPILRLNGVTEGDAGTYVCRVTNNSNRFVEAKAVLRVVGVIPRFDGNGWVALRTLSDAFRQFDIEISFKPQDNEGLILYNSQYPERQTDFLALQLVEGIPEFVMETGSGPVTVKGDRPLQVNEWHTIRLSKIGPKVTMNVDMTGPFVNETKENWILDLKEPLYIGGVPNYDMLPEQLAGTSAFVGCVSMLILGREEKNIMRDKINSEQVYDCNTCSPNYCLNNAVCQEALNERGFVCLCPIGFAGPNCERRGESCRPGSCGSGKCIDTSEGYKCLCPITHTGKNCEIRQNIEYPAFTGSAFVALKPPKTHRFLKFSIMVKPTAPVTDGIIMYCAESARGQGGFTSLAVRNGKLEFRYDVGEGAPVVLVSNTTLPANEWTDVQVTRSGPAVSLNINMKQKYEKQLNSSSKSLILETPMFVGGVDESIILNNSTGVTSGFMGCMKHLKTPNGDLVDIVHSSITSANVKECVDRGDIPEIESPCSCNNGGSCASDGSCICPPGYTGYYCETRLSPFRTSRRSQVEPCAVNPCRNGGTCKTDYGNMMNYSCDCPLGFSGASCQINLDLYQSVGFNGNGYLELPASLINYRYSEPVVIALAIHTTQNGVLLYQRQGVSLPTRGDFIMIRIDRGYVVLEWDMGSGTDRLSITEKDGFVTDGERHQIIVKMLADGMMELTVDSLTVLGPSSGLASTMNADSNIYIGGMPDSLNYYKYPGLNGCIEQIEFMNAPRGLNLGATAVAGRNTQRCKN